jgi:NADP-dependent 3-hydroxy acid dehydrogenase YdfG
VRFKGDEQKANTVYEGFEPLHAEDIAEIFTTEQHCLHMFASTILSLRVQRRQIRFILSRFKVYG